MKAIKKNATIVACVATAAFCAYESYNMTESRRMEQKLMIEENVEAVSASGESSINPIWFKRIIDGIVYLCAIIEGIETCVQANDSDSNSSNTYHAWVSQMETRTVRKSVNGKEIPVIEHLYKCSEVKRTEGKTENECDQLGEFKWI